MTEGAASVRAVDIKPFDEWYQKNPAADNRVLDLQLRDSCMEAAKGMDGVFQLAADMGGMGFIENNKALCMLTVLTSTHMLVAARDCGVKRLFYSSSACVYNGDKQKQYEVVPLKEEDAYPALPEDGYGWEKLFTERMCRHFREDFGLDCPRRALPQRLWPAGHLDGRTRKSAGRHQPQGAAGQALRQARDRNLGRRPSDPQLHVHRRLHQGRG